MRLLLLLLCLLCTGVHAGDPTFPLELKDLQLKSSPYRPASATKAVAVVFLLPDCPACQSYSKTLNDLLREFNGAGLELIGVFPGKFATAQEAESFRKDYRIAFPLFLDTDQRLVRKLGATVAPEVFLYDSEGTLRYSGRIDDWMVGPGKKRIRVTQRDLQEAVKAITQGRKLSVRRTTPVGCIIEQ